MRVSIVKKLIVILAVLTGCSNHRVYEVEGVSGEFVVPRDRILGRIPWDPSPDGGGFAFEGCLREDEKECIGPNYVLSGTITPIHEKPIFLSEIKGSLLYEDIVNEVAPHSEGKTIRINRDRWRRGGYIVITKIGSPGVKDGVMEAECAPYKGETFICGRRTRSSEYLVSYTYIGIENFDFERMDRDVIKMIESWRHGN